MNHYKTKTPEEKIAIVQKSAATRLRNKQIKAEELRLQLIRKDVVEIRIAELKEERDKLEREIILGNLSAKLTNKTMLTESEVVDGCQPWDKAVGVYFLIKNKSVVYVGQSTSVYSRISTHQHIKDFDSIAWVPCELHILDRLESLYIHTFRPPLNGNMNNGYKSAPMSLDRIFYEGEK